MSRKAFITAQFIFIFCAIIILFFVSFYYLSSNDSRYKEESYNMNISDAVESYNDFVIPWVKRTYSNTSTLISPLSVQGAIYNYYNALGKSEDALFHVFANGVVSFSGSKASLEDPSIVSFTVGEHSSNKDFVDINSSIKDQLTIDEVNARLKTLTNEGVVTQFTSADLYTFNIIVMCNVDNKIKGKVYPVPDNNVFGLSKNYCVASGEYKHKYQDGLYYTEIPLDTEGYTLVLLKGSNFEVFNQDWLKTGVIKSEVSIVLPETRVEMTGKPSSLLSGTELAELQEKDSNIGTITIINRINLDKDLYDEPYEGNIYVSYADNCMYMIRNARGQYILIGSVL